MEIKTTYNVGLEYEKANIAERIMATVLDVIIMTGYGLLGAQVLSSIGMNEQELFGISFTLLIMLPLMFYNLIFELLLNGQTPGKKALNIKVVRTDGERAHLSHYLLRWLLRPIEILACYGTVAMWAMIYNGQSQRLGDLAAGTCVIRNRKNISLDSMQEVVVEEGYQPVFPQASNLSDRDFRIIRELTDQATKSMNFDMLKKLSNRVKETLNVETELIPVDFLKTVVKDYYYYHG